MTSLYRNITLECSINKKMRSDHLRRHWLAELKSFDFKVTTVVRGFLKDKDRNPSSNEDLESDIVARVVSMEVRLGACGGGICRVGR